jgi:hypothetical protein
MPVGTVRLTCARVAEAEGLPSAARREPLPA